MIYLILFIVLVACCLIYAYIHNNKIKKGGIEAQGVVRISVEESFDSEGSLEKTLRYYVNYTAENGEKVEASIGNPKRTLKEGDKIKIKYLPKNPKYAVYIEKVDK